MAMVATDWPRYPTKRGVRARTSRAKCAPAALAPSGNSGPLRCAYSPISSSIRNSPTPALSDGPGPEDIRDSAPTSPRISPLVNPWYAR